MTYFNNVKTAEELKRQYRRLTLQFHPDRGGSEEDMEKINAEYNYLLRRVGHIHEKEDGEMWEETNKQDRYSCNIDDLDDGFREVLDALLKLKNITIQLVGSWIWISGDTKDVREDLKKAGCKYSGKRVMWYWHEGSKRRKASKLSYNEICEKYGCKNVSANNRFAIA